MTKILWNLNRLAQNSHYFKSLHRFILQNNTNTKLNSLISLRYINTTRPNLNQLNKSNLKVFYFIYNTLQYAFVFSATAGLGLLTGYYLTEKSENNNKSNKINESLKQVEYQATKVIENKKKEFPLRLHLYQYESDSSCTQIRTYLDYFGYEYKITEVDSLTKMDQLAFTMNKNIPVLVLQSRENRQRWHLANSTAIISALESIRNELENSSYSDILNKYLPVLKGNQVQATINPFKYHVSNTNLNSVEWRRWIDDQVQLVLRLNAISSFESVKELFDLYAVKSEWIQRYENKLKFYYAYYLNVIKTYLSASQLKSDLKLKPDVNEFDLLVNLVKKWENGLEKNDFIGGSEPNLADLSMYGCVKSYEECRFMQRILGSNLKFLDWFNRMKSKISSGYVEETNSKVNQEEEEEEKVETDKIVTLTNINQKEDNQIEVSKLLAANYVIHVVAFTYAKYMSSK